MAVREEFRFKAQLKKRWLYYVGAVFVYLLPLLMIIEKLFAIRHTENDVTLQACGFVFGIIFIFALGKKVREAIKKMKYGATREFCSNLVFIIPFATVGFLVYLVVNALQDFDTTAMYICISMAFGAIMRTVDAAINKTYLRRLRIYEIAKEKVDTEKEEERIKLEEAEEAV
jgi:hypothetical protein